MRRYAASGLHKRRWADDGSARPEIREYPEEQDFLYAMRLLANAMLGRMVEPHLKRPQPLEPGQPVLTYQGFASRASTCAVQRVSENEVN